MKNVFVALSLMTAMFISSVNAEDKVVHVYNWSDYIDEEILTEFEAETGIKVVYDVFDSNEILQAKLLAGGTGYDVVVPTDSNLKRQLQADIYQKLDFDALPNSVNLWGTVTDRLDPAINDYSVNYMWGTTGIGYNVDMIKERMPDAPVDSWAMLLDPEVVKNFADCGVHVLDSPDELLPHILAYLGEDPDSHDPQVLAKTEPVLQSIRPYIQKFHSSEYISALANGDICLAVGFSGDVFQARSRAEEADNGVKIEYSIPTEGALMWFDQFAIPADAPHPQNAHVFINYMMRPEVIAKASNYTYYANGNKASQPLIEAEVIEDPQIYPTEEVLANLFTTTPYPPKVLRKVTRLWTRAKTGQ